MPKSQKRQHQHWLILAVGAALVLTGLLLLPQWHQGSDVVLPEPKPYWDLAQGNSLGVPDAPLTVIEFSDFQCVHCQRWFQEVEPQFLEEFVVPGTVRFVYRTMGDFLGPESLQASMALYCAEEQGAFWPYHDALFLNAPLRPNTGTYRTDRLVELARALNLDAQAFSTCLETQRYRDRALQDKQEGFQYGVEGTPSFVLMTQHGDAYLLVGAQPLANFRQAIAQLLSRP